MIMFNIEQYLKRFSKNLNSLEGDKIKILEVVKKYTKIEINISNLEIKNYVVFIKTNAVGKNQIFLNKNKILEEIMSENIKIVDIK